ncbi:MAG: RNA polymerase sigma factor, partial [Pseudomonadota bacterium]
MIRLDPNLVVAARAGDRAALERLIHAAQRPIYNLAMRMLANPTDAEDAAQEILVKIVTHLGTLREPGAAGAWAMRLACRHLVNLKRIGRVEAMRLSFEGFAEDLDAGATEPPVADMTEAEFALAIKQVKIGCTLAMLVCLSRELRIAYVLGDVLELSEREAADVLEIATATYRQRLKRARDKVSNFMLKSCGLASETATCRCTRRIAPALAQGRIRQGEDQYETGAEGSNIATAVHDLDAARRAAALMRSNPDFPTNVGKLTLHVMD